MSIWQAIILGLVQGLTEFLPVSSSGHLVLGAYLLGEPLADEEGLQTAFNVALHGGTLLAVLVYFRADLRALAAGFVRSLRRMPARARGGTGPLVRDTAERMAWLVALGTVPAVVVALLFGEPLHALEDRPEVVAWVLLGFSFVFIVAERLRGDAPMESLGVRSAFFVGCAQALALVPGVSRSGSTISAGMMAGLERRDAARYSFLLAAPIVFAAFVREVPKLAAASAADGQFLVALVVGASVAALSGYLAVSVLLRFLASHSLSWFAAYRIPAAGAFLVWFYAS